MNRLWRYAAVAVIAGATIVFWPLTAALPPHDALQGRVASMLVAFVACAVLAAVKGIRSRSWIAVAIVSATAGVALLIAHFAAAPACVADYEGRPVIIGRDYAPDAEAYIRDNPGLSPADRLFDAGGVPERVWTADSIRSCRMIVGWAGLAAIPLFAVCAGALVSSSRHDFVQTPRRSAPSVVSEPAGTPVYDAFISYRHLEPDNQLAIDLLQSLEQRGLHAAIDCRDFSPNEHFLSEMQRCIEQSRFVLCVVTARYLESDHTSEEAIIAKTLDMAERRKRLVPLIFERVELPVWLHGLVGVDFTATAQVDPIERLHHLLAPPRSTPV
jgi:hypothetical protein